jgi:hypothetical protein
MEKNLALGFASGYRKKWGLKVLTSTIK